MQMTTKSQMILPTVKQGRRILQISSWRNYQHSQQTSSRMKTNLFLLRVHKSAESPQAKLLCLHYQLGDLPFTCLHILALIGTIPKWLLTVKAQKCAGYMYGAMTKQPWRMKGIQNKNKIQVATSPGDCVSMHWPAGISDTRIHSTTQRETYQKEIWRCHHLCPTMQAISATYTSNSKFPLMKQLKWNEPLKHMQDPTELQ
jgi:hypothetical protein